MRWINKKNKKMHLPILNNKKISQKMEAQTNSRSKKNRQKSKQRI